MERACLQDGTRILRMPRLVDESVLALVELELRRAPGGGLAVLDFALARHVRYRDLQRFARAAADAGLGPVRLAGLSHYCREIFRFALTPRDWEIFLEVNREWPAAATRTGAAAAAWVTGYARAGAARDGFPGGLPVPSPN